MVAPVNPGRPESSLTSSVATLLEKLRKSYGRLAFTVDEAAKLYGDTNKRTETALLQLRMRNLLVQVDDGAAYRVKG